MRFLKSFLTLALFFALFFNIAHAAPKPPKWYLAPQTDEKNLYGVGSAKNLETAKDNALNDLLGALQVKVQSDTNLTQSVIDGVESSAMSQNIRKKIDKTSISNVKYDTELISGVYYARAIVSKSDFSKAMKQQISNAIEELERLNLKCDDIWITEFSALENALAQVAQAQVYMGTLGISDNSSTKHKKLFVKNSPKPKVALVVENDQIGAKPAIEKELLKFLRLDGKSTQKMLVKISDVQNLSAQVSATMEVKVANCRGDSVYSASFTESNKNASALGNRLGVLLYKNLQQILEQ